MKKLTKIAKVIVTAAVLSIVVTASHGSNTHVDHSSLSSTTVTASVVDSEGACRQWSNHKKNVTSNAKTKKKNRYEVKVAHAKGLANPVHFAGDTIVDLS